MRQFIVLSLLLMFALIPHPGQAETLTLPFKANVGDKAQITILKKVSVPGFTPLLSFKYDVEIIDKTQSGYTFSWIPTKFDVTNIPKEMAKPIRKLLASAMLSIKYSSDTSGVPVKFVDKENIIKETRSLLKKTGNFNEQTFQKVEQLLRRMDDRKLALLFGKEAAMIARSKGLTMDLGKINKRPEKRLNVLGQTQFLATTFNSRKTENNLIEIKFQTQTDPALNSKTVRDKRGFTEKGKVLIDAKSGWVREVEIRGKYPKVQNRSEWIKIVVIRK